MADYIISYIPQNDFLTLAFACVILKRAPEKLIQ